MGMVARIINKVKYYTQQREDKAMSKQFYAMFVSPGDLCFDVGANIGNRVETFLALGSKVVAVEPQLKCAKVLEKKYGSNQNFVLIKKALGTQEGNAEMYVSSATTISSMNTDWIEMVKKSGRFQRHTWNKKVTVPTTTLDHLITQYGIPSFCKIDVEGFEYQVISGLSKPIKGMSFEFTQEIIEPTISCIHRLNEIGNYEFNYSLSESLNFAQSDWMDAETICSVLTNFQVEMHWGDVYARLKS